MNVYTIDFDIIMSPSIEFYNDLVGEEEPLSSYLDDFAFLTNLPADLYQYEYLTRFILMSIKHTDKVYFISSHKDVYSILKKLNSDEPINVTNIDHHHDIGYDDIENWSLPLSDCECGNWVKYCKDKKIFNKYRWIKNDNSIDPPEEAEKYLNEEVLFKHAGLENESQKVDVLILCASFEWVPPMYRPLFDTWQTICEENLNKKCIIDNF